MIKKFVLLTMFLAISAPALAADAQPRLVTVTGEGEVMAAPDEAVMNFQVQSFDSSLEKAVAANDAAVGAVLAVVKKYGVEESDFRTDYFNVHKQDNYVFDTASGQNRGTSGFMVVKNIAITLRDLGKLEALYGDALAAGVNNIYGVEFKTSELPKLREESRALAVQAAKDKAEKLASALGEKIGRAYAVQENPSEGWPQPRMMNMAMQAESASGGAGTIALGQIPVKSSVTVSFELK